MLIHKDLLKTVGCASTDPSRFQLNGIHFSRHGDKIRAVTTDGKTLCIVHRKEDDAEEYPSNGCSIEHAEETFILPNTTVKKIEKNLAKKCFKPILENFIVDETKLPCRTTIGIVDDDIESIDLSCQMVEGTYPDIDSVTESFNSKPIVAEMKINPALMIQAMKTIQAITGDKEIITDCIVREGSGIPIEFKIAEPGKEQTTSVYVMPLVTK